MKKIEAKYKYYAHILNSVADETEGKTFSERAQHIKDRFESEYWWNINRSGLQNAAQEWLQGLAINIDYMNHDILKRAESYGYWFAQERDEDKFLNQYWQSMAANLCHIINPQSTAIKSFEKRYNSGEFENE